jgi:hypothetical protein
MQSVAAAIAGAVAIAGVFVVLHRIDNRRTPTVLEATLLAFGPKVPAVVVGVADLRSVLGPRLDRRLIGIARGGAADEIPFADTNQVRRRVLGEKTPPPPAAFIRGFDRAVDKAGTQLLVVGAVAPLGFPDGWVPSDAWCLVGGDNEGSVFARPAALGPTVACVHASAAGAAGATPPAGQSAPGG